MAEPFDPKLWAKARAVACAYTLIIQPDPEVGFFGRTLEMPYVMADGPTHEACAREVLEATTQAVAVCLENGERPPQAADEAKRSAQVNVRLTEQEKFRIEEAAKRFGFRGVSDFVRTAALDKAG